MYRGFKSRIIAKTCQLELARSCSKVFNCHLSKICWRPVQAGPSACVVARHPTCLLGYFIAKPVHNFVTRTMHWCMHTFCRLPFPASSTSDCDACAPNAAAVTALESTTETRRESSTNSFADLTCQNVFAVALWWLTPRYSPDTYPLYNSSVCQLRELYLFYEARSIVS